MIQEKVLNMKMRKAEKTLKRRTACENAGLSRVTGAGPSEVAGGVADGGEEEGTIIGCVTAGEPTGSKK